MSQTKPFHRNFRTTVNGVTGWDNWAYIVDREYSKNPEHYIRAYELILNDLTHIFEFVEPSDESLTTYSYRIHALLMRTCIEVEANFKAILNENLSTIRNVNLSIFYYRKIDISHHLSSYEVSLPIWNGGSKLFKPFEAWLTIRGQSIDQRKMSQYKLPWYTAYNKTKHDRHDKFKDGNFEQLVNAVAGLTVLIYSQFSSQSFSAGNIGLSTGSNPYHQDKMAATTGGIFRIEYPTDWDPSEQYVFDWKTLKNQADRFQRFDYDSIKV